MCGNYEVYENKYCKNSCDCKQNEYHNENYYQSWNEVHLCVLCPAPPVQMLRPSVFLTRCCAKRRTGTIFRQPVRTSYRRYISSSPQPMPSGFRYAIYP